MNETTSRQWIDFESLKKTASVKAVLASLGLLDDMELVGSEWKGQCPFHKGENKNIKPFAFSRDKRAFYCHVCKRKGNVLDFVKQYLEWKNKEKVGVREAAEYIVSAMEQFAGEEEGEKEEEEEKKEAGESTPDVEAILQEARTQETKEEKRGEGVKAPRAHKETEKREREEKNSVLEELNPEYFLDFVEACKLVSLKGASPRDFVAVRVEYIQKFLSLLALTTR
jgi:hypothetical protein